MARVLVIPDVHTPCMLKCFPSWLRDLADQWETNRTVMIGDLIDLHSMSFHPRLLHLRNPDEERERAQEQIDELVAAFPRADWMIGNHDSLPLRWCETVGIPESMMLSPGKIWKTKRWRVHDRYADCVIDGVIYRHGDKGRGGGGGKLAAIANAQAEHRSLVQGHFHGQGGVSYTATRYGGTIFGMQVGTGIDSVHLEDAMRYSKKFAGTPVLGAGVVLDGDVAIFEPLPRKYVR